MLVAVAAIGAQPAMMFEGQEAGLSVILQNGTCKSVLVLLAGVVISVFSVTLLTIYGQTRIAVRDQSRWPDSEDVPEGAPAHAGAEGQVQSPPR